MNYPADYIIAAAVIAVLIVAGRMYRLYIKNRWKGLNDFGVGCVDTAEKICALTFDDGPHPVHTPHILDVLKKHDAKAAFFVLGKQVEEHPDIIKRMADEGHDIGNHSYNHARLSHSSKRKTLSELQKTQNAIQSITGQPPVMIRPPHGRFSREQEILVREHFSFPEHYVITWDVCTYDWESPPVDTLLQTIENELKPGSIILLHDVHQSTADNLDALIEKIRSMGFTIVSVSELLKRGEALKSR